MTIHVETFLVYLRNPENEEARKEARGSLDKQVNEFSDGLNRRGTPSDDIRVSELTMINLTGYDAALLSRSVYYEVGLAARSDSDRTVPPDSE
jgi:hypothetical protein